MTDPSTALPRVTIQFCTQCKWMLRAAYFAQELLSTFSTSLGEVALQPSTGGTFIVNLYTAAPTSASSEDGVISIQKHLLWDRKAEGGFPETKELKRRVRDVIDPNRDLGHVDGKKSTPSQPTSQDQSSSTTTTQPSSTPSSSLAADPTSLHQQPVSQANTSSSSAEERSTPTPTPTPTDTNTSSLSSLSTATTGQPAPQAEPTQAPAPAKEVLNSRGKIQIGGDEGFGFCRPGEDCEDCA